jgi:hypothetical protein
MNKLFLVCNEREMRYKGEWNTTIEFPNNKHVCVL